MNILYVLFTYMKQNQPVMLHDFWPRFPLWCPRAVGARGALCKTQRFWGSKLCFCLGLSKWSLTYSFCGDPLSSGSLETHMCFGFKLASHVGLLYIVELSCPSEWQLAFCFCRRNSLAVVEDTQHFPQKIGNLSTWWFQIFFSSLPTPGEIFFRWVETTN